MAARVHRGGQRVPYRGEVGHHAVVPDDRYRLVYEFRVDDRLDLRRRIGDLYPVRMEFHQPERADNSDYQRARDGEYLERGLPVLRGLFLYGVFLHLRLGYDVEVRGDVEQCQRYEDDDRAEPAAEECRGELVGYPGPLEYHADDEYRRSEYLEPHDHLDDLKRQVADLLFFEHFGLLSKFLSSLHHNSVSC